jgi:hypothetical protein
MFLYDKYVQQAPRGCVRSLSVLNVSNSDYINTLMDDHMWYVGNMDRDGSNARLKGFPVGTFLVRCRVDQVNGAKLGYALSLKTENDVKHMKICNSAAAAQLMDSEKFFLSDTRKFRQVFLRIKK